MKKDLYYRTLFRRENVLKLVILNFFFAFSSYPRMLLEVFIRKDFGERYFKLSIAVYITVILALWPLAMVKLSEYLNVFGHLTRGMVDVSGSTSLMPQYLGWYIFLVLFMLVCVKHHRDMKHNPSVFDFKKFSLYTGKINPKFYEFHLPDRKTDRRRVECLLEPAAFFIAGFVLYLIGQRLGGLLMLSSVFYGFSYVAAYISGDNFVMDKIDEMICNEELERSFVDGADESETRGFFHRGRRPNDKDMRRKILPLMNDNEEILQAG